jgi:hypothetical protein
VVTSGLMSAFPLFVRLVLLALAFAASLASSGNRAPPPETPANPSPGDDRPPPEAMRPELTLGLWHSSFGPVKMELDRRPGRVLGVWVYERSGQEVIGSFSGDLSGNVLQFRWEEPAEPPLRGAGYLVFGPDGLNFKGRWWTDNHDREGEWNGWRQRAGVGPGQAPNGAVPAERPAEPPPSSEPNQPAPPAPQVEPIREL